MLGGEDLLRLKVYDPTGLSIDAASAIATCSDGRRSEAIVADGRLIFANPTALPCSLEIRAAGFEPAHLRAESKGTLAVHLRLAEVHSTTTVEGQAPRISHSLESSRIASEQLLRYSTNSSDWPSLALRQAGLSSKSTNLLVNGLPSTMIPPSEMIAELIVGSDAFSAVNQDNYDAQLDIITKPPDRRLKLMFDGTPFGNTANSAFFSNAKLRSAMANGYASGAARRLPFWYSLRASLTAANEQQPIVAPLGSTSASLPIIGGEVASVRTTTTSIGATAQFAPTPSIQAVMMVQFLRSAGSNLGAGGITLPEAASALRRDSFEGRLSATRRGESGELRTQFGMGQLIGISRANSEEAGIRVPDYLVAGGASFLSLRDQTSNFNHTLIRDGQIAGRALTIGSSISWTAAQRLVVPNAYGDRQFESPEDYLNFRDGRGGGLLYKLEGSGSTQHRTVVSSVFGQTELASGPTYSIRAGVRLDHQRSFSPRLSPRLSVTKKVDGTVVRAGIGGFVLPIANELFVRSQANDESHLRTVLRWDDESGVAREAYRESPEIRINSTTSETLRRPEQWSFRTSVEHAWKAIEPSVEYSWVRFRHLLGTRRLLADAGWKDVLESNRNSERNRVRARLAWTVAKNQINSSYEWTRAMDDTDGPFSFPQDGASIRDEWANSAGVPRHSISLWDTLPTVLGISASVAAAWSGRTPLNITSGRDRGGLGIYTDRGGLGRNSGFSPSYSNVSLYLHRSFRLGSPRPTETNVTRVNVRFQVENLFRSQHFTGIGTVGTSPNFGLPLSAAADRSVSFRVSMQ